VVDFFEKLSRNLHVVFRPNQAGLKKVLGDLEAEVMEVIWAAGAPLLGKDIHARLPGEPPLAYPTVANTLAALYKKGLLRVVDKQGKACRYAPTVGREAFLRQTLGGVLDTLLADFPDTAAALLDERSRRGVSSCDVERLKERIARQEQTGDAS
jgi:predicted transcriptional regulator